VKSVAIFERFREFNLACLSTWDSFAAAFSVREIPEENGSAAKDIPLREYFRRCPR
jgi:hypothetical protein